MWLRRGIFYSLFGAVLVLPLWVLIGVGVLGDGGGWDFVALLIICPILAVFLLLLAGLTWARSSVRRGRAVSWWDVGLLGVLYLSLLLSVVVDPQLIAVIVIVVGIAGFWSAVVQLIVEVRNGVRSALDEMERTVSPASEYRMKQSFPQAERSADAPGAGQVIRIDPPTHD